MSQKTRDKIFDLGGATLHNLPTVRRPKVTKIQKVAGISNYYRTKLLKKVLIKNVHL